MHHHNAMKGFALRKCIITLKIKILFQIDQH